jgi:SWI/SNF-related matrix-associated actin-dependent regulator of chromatin subfamily A protein 2/4
MAMQVCNHPCLSYPPPFDFDPGMLVRRCGKFAMLDRMLVKLHATGHRVLLFSTMTRLLDLLETYLRWRRVGQAGAGQAEGQQPMGYLRIDGSTALEDRCSCFSTERLLPHFPGSSSSHKCSRTCC